MKTQRRIFVAVLTVCSVATGGALTGKVTAGKGNSVVYVESFAGAAPSPPAKHFVMDQKGLSFQPHILVVPVGSTVDFLNSDKVQHNIFWPAISGDKKMSHNMGTWPTGEIRPFKYDKPGIVPLLCNVHPEMGGYVIVVPNQHFAETDRATGFRQPTDLLAVAHDRTGLPAGQQFAETHAARRGIRDEESRSAEEGFETGDPALRAHPALAAPPLWLGRTRLLQRLHKAPRATKGRDMSFEERLAKRLALLHGAVLAIERSASARRR